MGDFNGGKRMKVTKVSDGKYEISGTGIKHPATWEEITYIILFWDKGREAYSVQIPTLQDPDGFPYESFEEINFEPSDSQTREWCASAHLLTIAGSAIRDAKGFYEGED